MLLEIIMLIITFLNILLLVMDTIFHLLIDYKYIDSSIFLESFNILSLELGFILVYLIELVYRFIIDRKLYSRWWLFFVFKWYDVVSLIPMSNFKILRFIRVISLLIKFNKLDKYLYLYDYYKKFKDIVIEEITDILLINILNRINNFNQDKLLSDTNNINNITRKFLFLPARASDAITERLIEKISEKNWKKL